MDLPPPRLIDKKFWILGNTHEQAISENIWEISVPQRSSQTWSIVLSYIISIFESSRDERKVKFDLILGDTKEIEIVKKRTNIRQKPTWKKVRDQVHSFNPFQNRPPLFLDGTMRHLIQMFRERLNTYGEQITRNGEIFDNSVKLGTVSRLLQCCIKVCQIDSRGKREIVEYISEDKNDNTTIVLFQKVPKTGQSRGRLRYSFGMNLYCANRLRRESLSVILREAQIHSDIILDIQNNLDYNENFLFGLLANSWRESIPQIFGSPYIPQKLSYAGFNTNPYKLEKNGVSAFSHSASLDTCHPLFILYNYSANCFYTHQHSIRCPSLVIANALKNLGSRLRNDFQILNNVSDFECRQTLAIKTIGGILKLNTFQKDVIHDIIKTNEDYSASQKFILKKRIIISILKNYDNLNETDALNAVLSYYIKYKDFYENIDSFTCLLLFDNILYLNPTKKSFIMDLIFSLFLTILSYKRFPKCEHGAFCNGCQLTNRCEALQCIPLSYRIRFKINCRGLLHYLINDSKEDENEPDFTLKIIIKELEKYPEIKEEFLFIRLIRYLTIASTVSFNINRDKGIYVIERALQVLGETLVTSEKNNILGCLLNFNLPLGLGEVLLCLRNHCFSHYQASSSFGKLNLEKDALKFDSLQPSLKYILEIVQQIYVMQVYRVERGMIENCKFVYFAMPSSFIQEVEQEKKRITEQQLEYFNTMKPKVKLSVENVINGLYRLIKEHKMVKDLKQKILTLSVFIRFIHRHCKGKDSQILVEAVERLSDFIRSNCDGCLDDIMKSKLTADVMNLQKIIENVFCDTVSMDTNYSNFDYSKLTQFLNDLKSFEYFTMQEIATIKQECLNRCKYIEEAENSLKDSLKKTSPLSLKEEEKLLSYIPMSRNKRELAKKALTRDPDKALKILNDLNDRTVLLNKVTDMESFIKFIDRQDNRNLLLSIQFPYHLNKKVLRFLNRKVECLLHSMKQLKIILIEENEEIKNLYTSKSSGENARKHAIFLMRERYKKDSLVRLSLEMLLFECQNILNYRPDFKHLWEKLSGLFSGINLRDVLSHGNTVLQITDENLDGNDLPANFIEKMLELVYDIEILEALYYLWSKSKPEDLEQFEIEIMQDKSSLVATIKKNPMWKSYMQLLPLH
ncbi:uncharacterized protein TNCT_498161 [Trichonephila clavata]|uniref:Uncharacterized protein n=1 Tax=Trichonephila clavata TaxID=2740835 RepID=A0A8X6LCZ7_TRICU|nr:uncharacterized protein TNCT_498161 [Trichonephila clavata]